MTLSGGLRGSALMKETGERTRIELTAGKAPAGLTLLTLGEGGLERVRLEGSGAEIRQRGIFALGLAREGRLIACGMSAKAGERARILERLRLAAAEEPAKRRNESAPKAEMKKEKNETAPAAEANKEKSDTPPQRGKAEKAVPSASVTMGILEQARRLFGALNGMNAEREEAARSGEQAQAAVGAEAESVANPFPRTFPGAVWERKPGEASLIGTVKTPSGPRPAEAIPIGPRGTAMRPPGRALIGRDGRRYWVIVGS